MKTRLTKPLFVPLIAGLLGTGMFFTACNNTKDSKDVADQQNADKFDNKADDNNPQNGTDANRSPNKLEEHDADFVSKAANMDLAEIYVSQQALSRAANANVKSIAQMMIDDHTKTSAQIKELAGKYNISLPTSPSDDDIKNWKGLLDKKGKDFDKDYVDWLVKTHKDAVDDFGAYSKKDDNQPEVRQWAANTLPALTHHLEMSQKLQDQLK